MNSVSAPEAEALRREGATPDGPREGIVRVLLLAWFVAVVKERTSLVSTPSLAELYRFAMNFLLVRKRKRKRNRDGRKRGK